MLYTVIFRIQDGGDVKYHAEPGENILEIAQKAGVNIDVPCGGNGTCGKCKMRIMSGSVAYDKTNSKLSDEEYDDNWRLACQSTVEADVTLFVPSSASDFISGILTASLSTPAELQKYNERIDEVFSHGISRGVKEKGYGIAVDIGTTTNAVALLDLEKGHVLSRSHLGNGQIRYGADVINRIIQQGRPGGKERLQHAVIEETLIPLFNNVIKDANVDPMEVTRVVIAGNTTMEHLLVKANGDSIRLMPFEPEFLDHEPIKASELRFPINPDAKVILCPNVGSYVGGDITAGVLPALLWDSDDMHLFIDLGTNGELVFGNRDYMLTCACSAGPAFEGGDISCGMRATRGAIDSCVIHKQTLMPLVTTVQKGRPAGMCGSGLIDVIAELYKVGAIDAKGKFIREDKRIRDDGYGDKEYVLFYADESATGRDIYISESDIDNFIRAKGAIFSAVRTLVHSVDMHVHDIDKVILAGGIGSGIDMENAMCIGMLPKADISRYSYIGNSSITGACAMLISDEATDKVFEIAHNMTYIELSTEPGYMDEFSAACFIPHTDATLFE
ncbi:MAG: DUF4445 domain-containing protein [Firmicutes bacterium]|nr:DUF4445 domain-containing protein [Bacillota bacterium]